MSRRVARPMSHGARAAGLLLPLLIAPLAPTSAQEQGQARSTTLPHSTLAVAGGGRGVANGWWRADSAPARWSAPAAAVAGAVRWTRVAPGVEHGTLRLAGTGEASRIAIVLVRLDPRVVTFDVHARPDEDDDGDYVSWSIGDELPKDAGTVLAAFNAGQFRVGRPWGWLVADGVELQRPGVGPLSTAFVLDSTGTVSLVDAAGLDERRRRGGVIEAFQSYPTILRGDGEVPDELHAPGRGVSVAHRDSRFALGMLRDGHVLLALTRFDLLGGAFAELPLGPTVPEMAAIMGALGCAQAMLLDGGISGQLRVAGAGEWKGYRRVPVAMLVRPRTAHTPIRAAVR